MFALHRRALFFSRDILPGRLLPPRQAARDLDSKASVINCGPSNSSKLMDFSTRAALLQPRINQRRCVRALCKHRSPLRSYSRAHGCDLRDFITPRRATFWRVVTLSMLQGKQISIKNDGLRSSKRACPGVLCSPRSSDIFHAVYAFCEVRQLSQRQVV